MDEATLIGGPDHNELVIALVAAVGTDVDMIANEVRRELAEYDYKAVELRLSEYLAEEAGQDFDTMPFDEALWQKMTAGNLLRQTWGRGDALVLNAISDIVATRGAAAQGEPPEGASVGSVSSETPSADEPPLQALDANEVPPPLHRTAFVLRSLKTQDEVSTLRAVYGPRLIVVAVFSPREARIEHLATKIADSRGRNDPSTWAHSPEALVDRDEKEAGEHGQDVSGTFHRADLFVRGWDRDVARIDLQRTFEILFGSPFRTPTRDEHGQFFAAGAALRSAELGRQVGAAIATSEGSLLAVGTNEVPKAGGGSHWEEDGKGNRDFETRATDANREQYDRLAQQLAEGIDQRVDALVADIGAASPPAEDALKTLRERIAEFLPSELKAGGLKDLTEFGRAVHAEMNALLDALRRGVSVQDSTLFSTTFPCHNCARHIIAAGVARVVFIEPYPKSRAGQLHADSMTLDGDLGTGTVSFEPFVGVAPRRYMEFFQAVAREELGHAPRRGPNGLKTEFDKRLALPIFTDGGQGPFRPAAREYRAKELLALEHLDRHRRPFHPSPVAG